MKHDKRIADSAALFAYDPDTGQITRNGAHTGTINNQGYLRIHIEGIHVQGHRLAWFLHYGKAPEGQIDHVNGNRADNRICNLRDVTASLNRMNQRLRSDNTSGRTGVIYHSTQKRWIAQICVLGKRKQIGSFRSRDDAVAAREEAQSQFGFGPNHGASRA